jgi:hypothetical protein
MSPITVAIASILVLASISPLTVQAKNVTAILEVNAQSVLEAVDNGISNVHDAWYTIDGKRNGNWSYDMSDWIWDDSDDGFNDSPLSEEFVLPSDGSVKICLEDESEYKSCKTADNGTETITFLYPAGGYNSHARNDYNNDATDDEADCWVNGYDDGFAGRYDADRGRECEKIGDDNYDYLWSLGCKDAGFSSRECEDIRDPR